MDPLLYNDFQPHVRDFRTDVPTGILIDGVPGLFSFYAMTLSRGYSLLKNWVRISPLWIMLVPIEMSRSNPDKNFRLGPIVLNMGVQKVVRKGVENSLK